ncbi:MAG TPA: PilZ domain-containing protein [Terriglobales bacterium]|nr:PilZ domain-containing protein [Terriglobales bacterium]
MSETRTSKRFEIRVPITIEASDSVKKLDGITDNVSAAGVFLHANAQLKIGSKVSFEIVLPREMTGGTADVKLQCHGTVVRTEAGESQDKTGVACVIDGYEFVRTA